MSQNIENNNLPGGPDFGLPQGYFQSSASLLMNKLEWLEEHKQFEILTGLKSQFCFTVPEDYFDRAEQQCELLAYPVLNKMPKATGFSVPQNYFAGKATVQETPGFAEKKEARIVSLFVKRSLAAMAAVFIIAMGIWLYSAYVVQSNAKDCGTIACLDKAELLKSTNLENLETDDLYELVNTNQLEQKLDNKGSVDANDRSSDSIDHNAEGYFNDEI